MPSRYSFPKSERLMRKREFDELFKLGARYVGRGFILYRLRQEGCGRKFGCIVSKKVGSSVIRNRVKRYIREVYRGLRPVLQDNVRMVVVAKPDARDYSYYDCKEVLAELFRQGGAMND